MVIPLLRGRRQMQSLIIKAIGSLFVFCGGALTANYFNRRADVALSEVEVCLRFVRYVRDQVASYAMPLTEILARIDNEEILRNKYSAKNFKELAGSIRISDIEVRKCIRKFLNDFGRASREEEIKECDECIRMILARRNALAENISKQKKINTALCIASALALIILML